VVGILIIIYSILLNNQAILTDSVLPIIEAHRPDNFLFLVFFFAGGIGALSFIFSSYLTTRYIYFVTESSLLSDMLESAKDRLEIRRNVIIRVDDDAENDTTYFRSVLDSTIVVSTEAQPKILQDSQFGEVVITKELSSLQNSKPWLSAGGRVCLCAFAAMFLISEPYLADL
jgi:hypothetical protein